MAQVILELFNRLGHITERHKFSDFPITIGRAYGNDLILSDQYVSPQHIAIHEVEGGWLLEDLESTNGIQLIKSEKGMIQKIVSSGHEFILGKTRIRLVSVDHPVAPTFPLPKKDKFESFYNNPLVVISLVIFAITMLAISYQLNTAEKQSIEKIFAYSILPVLLALIWASIWSFVGRIIKHKFNFLYQLFVSTLFLFGLIITTQCVDYILYNSNSDMAAEIIEFIFVGIVLSLLLSSNIDKSTFATPKSRILLSNSIAWTILLFLTLLNYVEKPDFDASPSYPAVIKPPIAKLVPSVTLDAFILRADDIFNPNNH